MQGMNNPKYHAGCIELMRKSIDNCADAGFPTVITFTGYAEETGPFAGGQNPDIKKLSKNRPVISAEDGIKNCVEGYKKIVGYAEKKKINLTLEILNTRADDHPMKGHPGYQGDHVDLLYGDHQQSRLASSRFAVRHLPRANHGRRPNPPHQPVRRSNQPRPHRWQPQAAASWMIRRKSTTNRS